MSMSVLAPLAGLVAVEASGLPIGLVHHAEINHAGVLCAMISPSMVPPHVDTLVAQLVVAVALYVAGWP